MVDALLIGASTARPIRFVMDHCFFAARGLRLLCRAGRVIPIASRRENAAIFDAAFSQIDEALRAGELGPVIAEKVTAKSLQALVAELGGCAGE